MQERASGEDRDAVVSAANQGRRPVPAASPAATGDCDNSYHSRFRLGARVLSAAALAASLFAVGCAGAAQGDTAPGEGEDVAEESQAIQGGYVDASDSAVVGVAITDAQRQHLPHLLGLAHRAEPGAHGAALRRPRRRSSSSATARASALRSPLATPSSPSIQRCGAIETVVVRRDANRRALGRRRRLRPRPRAHRARAEPRGFAPLTPRLAASSARAETYSAVGFGITGDGADDGGYPPAPRRAPVTCVADGCGTRAITEGDEWRGDHGICSGDSGGPAIDEQGCVIGVTSRGPVGCDDPSTGASRSGAAGSPRPASTRPRWAATTRPTGSAAASARRSAARASRAIRSVLLLRPATNLGWGSGVAALASGSLALLRTRSRTRANTPC